MSFNEGLLWGIGYKEATQHLRRKPKVICHNCGHIYYAKLDKCPKCHHPNEDKNQPAYWTT